MLQTLYPKCEGNLLYIVLIHSCCTIGPAVCHLMNIIMVLLTVSSSVHGWFYQCDMLHNPVSSPHLESTIGGGVAIILLVKGTV